MQYMGMFERLHGSFGTEFQLHTKVLVRLTKLRGGLESVGSRVQTTLSNYDFFTSVAIGKRFLESTSVHRVPLAPTKSLLRRWQPLLEAVPQGFKVLSLKGELSTSLLEKLIRINTYHMRTWTGTGTEYDKHMSAFEDFTPRYSTWWEACPSIKLADVDGQPAFEKPMSRSSLVRVLLLQS